MSVGGAEPDLAAFGGIRPGHLALDAAGGRGRAAAILAAAGARVVLLDRSAEALAEADPALRARLLVVRGNAAALPFPAGVFDAVVLRAVVHHLPDPAAALREAARAAKPGGTVVVLDKTAFDDLPARALRNAVERLRHPGHVWSWSERELRNLAGAARLEVEATERWVETRDAEEWLARGDCAPPWDGIVREMLQADLRRGGKAFGSRRGEGGALLLEERWAAIRMRKPGGAR